jgi:hypothetical protein
MSEQLTPMRWPGSWQAPSALALLKETPINTLLLEKGVDLGPVAARAREMGLNLVDPSAPPAGVNLVAGEWPGVQMPRPAGGEAAAGAGPTGVPWVDSNGWKIRLESALKPGRTVWVDARPKDRVYPASYVLAFADSAAHGGRWIVSLEESLAADLEAQRPEALAAWKKLAGTAAFFAGHAEWEQCLPAAVIGILSDFAGENEFMGQELCNLVARTNQQYRIILKNKVSASSLAGLKAVIYGDAAAPDAALRKQVLAFVEAGGTLITGPKWGPAPGTPAKYEDHFRYTSHNLGKGKVAMAKADPDDPYTLANDAVVLMSHRHELLRFWNGGAVGSYFTLAADRKRAIIHLLFYANAGARQTAVRVAGKYRTGRLWTLDGARPAAIEMTRQGDSVELHLGAVRQYAAAELEV